jgi:hypothetical protein
MNIGKGPHRASESFRMIPDRLWLHPGIKDFDLRLWCCLWFLARDRGHCFETDQAIAEKMKVSAKTVQRGLQNLERGEFLKRTMMGRDRQLDLRPEGDGRPMIEFALRIA